MDEKKPNSGIPSSAFDVEYSTQWRDEVDFLAKRGIYYTFRYKEPTYGITSYKYTKTCDLFCALTDFYLRNKRDAKSRAKFTGYKKYTQPSFVNKDGTLNEAFVQKDNVIELSPKVIDAAKEIIRAAEQKDDTE